MGISKYFSTALLAVMFFSLNAAEVAPRMTGSDKIEFHKMRVQLDAAFEKRNFTEVKSILDELFPLIRKDIKATKKRLSQAQKGGQTNRIVLDLTDNLSGKEELYESMKSLVGISTAALRARADHFKSMINQYDDLMASSY